MIMLPFHTYVREYTSTGIVTHSITLLCIVLCPQDDNHVDFAKDQGMIDIDTGNTKIPKILNKHTAENSN